MIKSTRNFYINIANEIKENLEKYNRKIFYNITFFNAYK